VAASGGTLFLDEIGEMSPASQAKILRALEEKKVVPVGSEKAVAYDARIIAATNQHLLKRVEQRKFRQDLYYRLCGLEIVMPPLRERVQDIALLAMHFLQKAGAQPGAQAPEKPLRLSNQALEMFAAFHWPGNVRQLEQAIGAAAAICEGEEIQVDDFPAWLRSAVRSQGVTPAPSTGARHTIPSSEPPALLTGRAGSGDERARYLKALEATRYPGTGRWNLSAAARKLRIPRKTLIYRLRKLGVVS
jgi:DNA-binding NtrC family response regulator